MAKREIFDKECPEQPGGGTVVFVNNLRHEHISILEEREEAGTPNIFGCVRAGLAFQIKHQTGLDEIHCRETEIVKFVDEKCELMDGVEILGIHRGNSIEELQPIAF